MYKINKGIDRPPEVLAIRGMPFLMLLAGSTVGLLVLTVVFMLISHLSSVVCFSVFLGIVFALYGYLARQSKLYGERGLTKLQGRRLVPGVVLARSSAPFRAMRSGGGKPVSNPATGNLTTTRP